MQQFLDNNIVNFLWGVAAFIVFVLIVFRFGTKHILAAVDAREAKIAKQMKEAEEAYVRAKSVQADVEAKFAAAEGRIAGLIADARKHAEDLKHDMVEKGRAEIETLRHRSIQDIEAARHTALVSMRDEIAEISVSIAERIIRERIDARTQDALVAETMAAYANNQGRR